MRISSIINDSIVDGPGLRLTVFTQGCPHACPGCHNPETHDPLSGYEVDVDRIAEMMEENPLLSGITLSGGDPFLQARECSQLAMLAHRQGLNVWTYTGYTYETLTSAKNIWWDALLAQTDVLVDGPFILEQKSYAAIFRGSTNQRLIDIDRTRKTGNLTLWTP